MSEYWKSAPKYWCKFCKVYVRDTKFDKQQHDATGRHQGSVQRSLRTLHRDHERQERDTQRAKDEVARLNGIVSGKPAASGSKNMPVNSGPAATAPPAQATLEDRKRQLAQLAEMGVAIPKEYRADMALAGDWETTQSNDAPCKDDKHQVKNIGIRKRKHEGAEEEEQEDAADSFTRKAWGSTVKMYPGKDEKTEDIAALLMGRSATVNRGVQIKKEEDLDEAGTASENVVSAISEDSIKKEDVDAEMPVVFKKRKSKIVKTG